MGAPDIHQQAGKRRAEAEGGLQGVDQRQPLSKACEGIFIAPRLHKRGALYPGGRNAIRHHREDGVHARCVTSFHFQRFNRTPFPNRLQRVSQLRVNAGQGAVGFERVDVDLERLLVGSRGLLEFLLAQSDLADALVRLPQIRIDAYRTAVGRKGVFAPSLAGQGIAQPVEAHGVHGMLRHQASKRGLGGPEFFARQGRHAQVAQEHGVVRAQSDGVSERLKRPGAVMLSGIDIAQVVVRVRVLRIEGRGPPQIALCSVLGFSARDNLQPPQVATGLCNSGIPRQDIPVAQDGAGVVGADKVYERRIQFGPEGLDRSGFRRRPVSTHRQDSVQYGYPSAAYHLASRLKITYWLFAFLFARHSRVPLSEIHQ